ncbi:MAG TPA: CorA family divalent cation transporter [Nakamurella sp.]
MVRPRWNSAGSVAVIEVSGVHWASSKAVAEAVLSRRPGVIAVDANPVSQTATVNYDPARTSVAELSGWVRDCGAGTTSVQQNDDMRRITAWVAIVDVPTAVTGFFGQNVPYPGFGEDSGFIASVAIMLIIAGTLFLLFKRKNWL